MQLNKRALCRPRYYRPKYHEIYGLRLACTKRYHLHVRFFVNLFFPSLSPLSSSSLLLFLLPLLSILLLLLLLPSSHGVILVSEFLPRGADKKSDRKRGEGHRKGGAIRLRGQIGRDTRLWRERERGGNGVWNAVWNRWKRSIPIRRLSRSIKTFLKQRDRCDGNATTASRGKASFEFLELTSQLSSVGLLWFAKDRSRIDRQAWIWRCLFEYFAFFFGFPSILSPDISMKRVWMDRMEIYLLYI